VGRNGVSFDKVEGDGGTPGGLYAIGFAFGNMEKPETGLEYRKVTGQSYWVDDPDSGYYNQWVEGGENRDWKSAEHLSESKNAYAYAAVIEYNTGYEKIAGKGSAIFLHCGLSPTSGCVAVGESDMLKLLGWLKADKNPHILIVSENAQ
jgi:L,D-peptidoglycan transpeptidase YkuD (ErfK/YbiS/YcfS/YnhG family)